MTWAACPTAAIIETLNRDFGYNLDVAQTQEDKERRYLEMLHTVTEIKAVADIARAHHGKVPIAVASSGMGRVVTQTLTAVGLISLFDVIVTADDVTHGKPAPDLFLLAAERLGVAPADCIVYEDGDPGLEAARRAGMRAVDVSVLWRDDDARAVKPSSRRRGGGPGSTRRPDGPEGTIPAGGRGWLRQADSSDHRRGGSCLRY